MNPFTEKIVTSVLTNENQGWPVNGELIHQFFHTTFRVHVAFEIQSSVTLSAVHGYRVVEETQHMLGIFAVERTVEKQIHPYGKQSYLWHDGISQAPLQSVTMERQVSEGQSSITTTRRSFQCNSVNFRALKNSLKFLVKL